MNPIEVAHDVLNSLPARAYRPDEKAASRDRAAIEIAFWMSRAAVLANALIQANDELEKHSPGYIEYLSWADSRDAAGGEGK